MKVAAGGRGSQRLRAREPCREWEDWNNSSLKEFLLEEVSDRQPALLSENREVAQYGGQAKNHSLTRVINAILNDNLTPNNKEVAPLAQSNIMCRLLTLSCLYPLCWLQACTMGDRTERRLKVAEFDEDSALPLLAQHWQIPFLSKVRRPRRDK